MTAEEFVAKWGVDGGADPVTRSSPQVARSYELRLTIRGRTGVYRARQNFHGENDHDLPAMTARTCVYILAAFCRAANGDGKQWVEFPWLRLTLWTTEWDAEQSATLWRWMDNGDMWADFLAITSLS